MYLVNSDRDTASCIRKSITSFFEYSVYETNMTELEWEQSIRRYLSRTFTCNSDEFSYNVLVEFHPEKDNEKSFKHTTFHVELTEDIINKYTFSFDLSISLSSAKFYAIEMLRDSWRQYCYKQCRRDEFIRRMEIVSDTVSDQFRYTNLKFKIMLNAYDSYDIVIENTLTQEREVIVFTQAPLPGVYTDPLSRFQEYLGDIP